MSNQDEKNQEFHSLDVEICNREEELIEEYKKITSCGAEES